jgi:hypothetical protein
MDVEFYHRAAEALGPPVLLPEPGAVIGLHADQVTEDVTTEQASAELEAVAAAHPPRDLGERMELWHRRRALR